MFENINNNSYHKILKLEIKENLDSLDLYKSFQLKVDQIKRNFLMLLIDFKNKGLKICAYGAAAKGNTLLNFCGIDTSYIKEIYDANTHKQGLFSPGGHIPIVPIEKLIETKPDVLIILPWNLKDELLKELFFCKEWGCKFITVIPSLEIF